MNFETLIDKLEYLYEAKLAIKKAIEDGGVIVPADCKFKDYAKYIKQLAPSSENVGDETKIDIKNRINMGVVISDTRICSKSQQISILNDIYIHAAEMGYNNVIHCGNFTEGLYSSKSEY